MYNDRQASVNSVHWMRTEYVDYGGIIAAVYALKKVLHLQILTGNQEHKRSQK